MTHPDEDLITTAEAADVLGVTVWVIHRHRRAGRLTEARKAGPNTAALLFRRADVLALKASADVGGDAA